MLTRFLFAGLIVQQRELRARVVHHHRVIQAIAIGSAAWTIAIWGSMGKISGPVKPKRFVMAASARAVKGWRERAPPPSNNGEFIVFIKAGCHPRCRIGEIFATTPGAQLCRRPAAARYHDQRHQQFQRFRKAKLLRLTPRTATAPEPKLMPENFESPSLQEFVRPASRNFSSNPCSPRVADMRRDFAHHAVARRRSSSASSGFERHELVAIRDLR